MKKKCEEYKEQFISVFYKNISIIKLLEISQILNFKVIKPWGVYDSGWKLIKGIE